MLQAISFRSWVNNSKNSSYVVELIINNNNLPFSVLLPVSPCIFVLESLMYEISLQTGSWQGWKKNICWVSQCERKKNWAKIANFFFPCPC